MYFGQFPVVKKMIVLFNITNRPLSLCLAAAHQTTDNIYDQKTLTIRLND